MPAKKSTAKRKTAKKTAAKKTTASKTKKSSSPKVRAASGKTKAKKKAGDQEVTIDRRTTADRRDASNEAAAPKVEKREKVQRRRQIDPTTCERDYSEQEVEFMNAMDEYKRTSGRMFPTCSEVLEVIRDLGYVQLSPAEVAIVRPEVSQPSEPTEVVEAEETQAEELQTAEFAV